MSAVAGRVMPLPRGTYNASTEYHILDIVSYNNAAYMALGTTQGNLPTNTSYWQKLVDSATQLSQLADVDTTGIASGKFLGYNGTYWTPQDIPVSGQIPVNPSSTTNLNIWIET